MYMYIYVLHKVLFVCAASTHTTSSGACTRTVLVFVFVFEQGPSGFN